MSYRAVKENVGSIVIAIGTDENQGGQDYNGVGVWCDFTFEDENFIPSQELLDEATLKGYEGSLLVVDGELVRLMAVNEVP